MMLSASAQVKRNCLNKHKFSSFESYSGTVMVCVMFKLKLHWQILIALLFGVIAGTLIQREFGLDAKETVYVGTLKFLGNTVFIGLLKMVIVPLIFSSIVAGIAGRKKSGGFGRLGLKTLGYYMLTSSVAILIGLSVVNLMKPGLVDGQPNPELVKFMNENSEEFEKKGASVGKDATGLQDEPHPLGVVGSLIERMIPENVFQSASNNGAMLSLIFISILTAFGLLSLQGQA
ncbi:MAG: dicarboxylate/amino acid:cation symporter, partial [Verrucomicrobiales bacterium]